MAHDRKIQFESAIAKSDADHRRSEKLKGDDALGIDPFSALDPKMRANS